MHAREELSGTGTSRRNNRDFDDDDELAPDEENELAVRYLEDADQDPDDSAEDDQLYQAEVENGLPGS